jgi:hypothetical protein
MIADVLVDRHLHLKLSRSDFAMTRGIFFVNKFDCKDRVVFCEGACFFDTISI